MRLTDLPDGASATVEQLSFASPACETVGLQRLAELGFIEGEPVQLVRRGPGGKEPLAVMVGGSMFALRWIEAQCVEVRQG